MKLDYPILKNWSLTKRPPANPYQAPELGTTHFQGEVFGNPRFEDGASVTTSSVQNLILEQGVILVKTANSIYIIKEEDVHPEYEAAFPNAFGRLKSSIEE